MRRRLTIIIFLVFVLSLTLASFLMGSVNAYDNQELGYSIDLPEGWTTDENLMLGQVMFNAPYTDAYIDVVVQKSYGDTAVELVNSLKQSRSADASGNFTVLFEGPQAIGDLNGYQIEYTIILGGAENRVHTFVSVESGKQYVIGWGTLSYPYSLVSSEIENSINSFQVTSSTSSPSPSIPEFTSFLVVGLVIVPTFAGVLLYKKRHPKTQ